MIITPAAALAGQYTICSWTDGSPSKHFDPEKALQGPEFEREAQL